MLHQGRNALARIGGPALMCAALALASAAPARAQAVVRAAKIGSYVAYGLDAVKIRLTSATVERGGGALPAPMRDNPSGQPIAGKTDYVALTFEVRNDGTQPENIPLLQGALELTDGTTIDPAVYGPFVGNATREAPTSTTIAPHRSILLRVYVGDVPHDRRVRGVVFNPNDATAAYRFDLRARDVSPLH